MREAGRDVYDGLEIGVDVVRNSWARPLHRQTSHRKANVGDHHNHAFARAVMTGETMARDTFGSTARAPSGTISSSSGCGGASNTRRWCAANAIVRVVNNCGVLPEMRVGSSKSACRGRLQTAAICIG